MPAKRHPVHFIGLDILPDILFQQFFAHQSLLSSILHRLVKIVAIGAVQIASRAGRLQHGHERSGGVELLRIREGEYLLLFHLYLIPTKNPEALQPRGL